MIKERHTKPWSLRLKTKTKSVLVSASVWLFVVSQPIYLTSVLSYSLVDMCIQERRAALERESQVRAELERMHQRWSADREYLQHWYEKQVNHLHSDLETLRAQAKEVCYLSYISITCLASPSDV